jgi:formylglycine-generating enzyme required for sulfatase activity
VRSITGIDVSLPTEAQWEYSARGGDTGSVYPWGNTFDAQYAWPTYDRRTTGSVFRTNHIYINKFGLTDMVGHVFEWCLDTYARYPVIQADVMRQGVRELPAPGLAGMLGRTVTEVYQYVDIEERAPDLTIDPHVTIGDDENMRVVRGGRSDFYAVAAHDCRCAARRQSPVRGWFIDGIGFRLAAGPA